MIKTQVLLQGDYYKQLHYKMHPDGLTKLYSNLTPRKSRVNGVNKIVVFGFQYFIKEYLINQWGDNFFKRPWNEVEKQYLRFVDSTLGKGTVDTAHIKKLHELQYLPLSIKALPEGTLCPIRVPCLTITNTVDHAAWLVNFLETILSCTTWQPITSATIALEYKKIFTEFAKETCDDLSFVQWQGHCFALRGLSSLESGMLSGAGHLLSFTGSDSIPAGEFLEQYYNADVEKELVLSSVPASEHSIHCLGGEENEEETYERLLDKFPTGVLSLVSDTWSLPRVLTKTLPKLKDKILKREGTLTIRPDSFWTNPADCLCGFDGYHPQMDKLTDVEKQMIKKGLIESLWDIFGGTINSKGYKVLDSHLKAIYGDSLTISMIREINQRLKEKGFSSCNWIGGCGSFGYQMNTRDSFGLAIKATHAVINNINTSLFKDPVTDDGMKKSAKGLLRVDLINNKYVLKDQCTPEEEAGGELKEVFCDGKLLIDHKLSEIRARVNASV